jgi:hypothetical protein
MKVPYPGTTFHADRAYNNAKNLWCIGLWTGITGAAIISIASLIFNSFFFWKYLSIYLSFEAFN